MKKLSIILFSALAALAACTKSKEVHPEIGDGNDEIIMVSVKEVHVEYVRVDHADLQKVVFHYSPVEARQFEAAIMTKQHDFFELTLNNLLSDTLYCYYYELFSNGGSVSTTERKTFHTQVMDTPAPPTPPSGVPEGAIDGLFTINANGDQVYFSQGNLQYQASTNTWRFAEHQWDYVGTQIPDEQGYMGGYVDGSDNHLISSTYTGWIDLFGWGTSGWDCGNVYYHPWDSAGFDAIGLYGPEGFDLTDSYANSDWGVFNSINNGGNTINTWRTLSRYEWEFLIDTRNTASGVRFAKAKVSGINGLLLLPDNWDANGIDLNNTNSDMAHYDSNVLTVEQLVMLEKYGTVFLPAAGDRGSDIVRGVGLYGSYWSVSGGHGGTACFLNFSEESLYPAWDDGTALGNSVRLVQDANP